MTDRPTLSTVAARCAYASAVVSAVGVVLLLIMYVGFLTPAKALRVAGPMNDVCVVIQYALVLPAIFAVHRLLRPHAPGASAIAAAIGLCGVIGTIVFQVLLLAGLMKFRDQVVYASISVLVIGVWIIVVGALGRRTGVLRAAWPLSIFAALYFGYPFWVHWLSRKLSTE